MVQDVKVVETQVIDLTAASKYFKEKVDELTSDFKDFKVQSKFVEVALARLTAEIQSLGQKRY